MQREQGRRSPAANGGKQAGKKGPGGRPGGGGPGRAFGGDGVGGRTAHAVGRGCREI
jgi:hypothetical protein